MLIALLCLIVALAVSLVGSCLSRNKRCRVCDVTLVVCSLIVIPLFVLLQRQSGNPDAGRELSQLYLPIVMFAAAGFVGGYNLMRKRRRGSQGRRTPTVENPSRSS